MVELLTRSAAFLILAAVAMWAVLILVRSYKDLTKDRRDAQYRSASAALIKWSDLRDASKIDDALIAIEPALLPEILARFFSVVTGPEKNFVLAALDRLDFAGYVEGKFRNMQQGGRLLFCELLGDLHGESSRAVLERALRDGAPSVRVGAAISLAKRGELPPLKDTLDELGPSGRRTFRHIYLFNALLPGRRDEVSNVATDPSFEPALRISALHVLIRHWNPETHETLRVLADDPCPEVAAAAARLFGGVDQPEISPLLRKLLRHPEPRVRRVAVESAGLTTLPGLQEDVNVLLDDEDALVREAARLAAARLSERRDATTSKRSVYELERRRRLTA